MGRVEAERDEHAERKIITKLVWPKFCACVWSQVHGQANGNAVGAISL